MNHLLKQREIRVDRLSGFGETDRDNGFGELGAIGGAALLVRLKAACAAAWSTGWLKSTCSGAVGSRNAIVCSVTSGVMKA